MPAAGEMNRRVFLLIVFLAACRTTTPTRELPIAEVHALTQRDDVARAMQFVDSDRDAIIAQWRTMTEIPAPSGQEAARADVVEKLLRDYGLTDVHRDTAGNVIGVRKGSGGGHRVVFDAHLDTVFPATTTLQTHIENGRIYAPGVGDDTRNVVSLLAMIRAMNAANVTTEGDITFVFTVREETDFGGVDQFLADHKNAIDRYVALDGGYRGFTYAGIGTYWYRYHLLGPGGHTRSNNPPYSATLPVARAIDRLYKLKIPNNAWLNVGMLGAGDVYNAKARDAWFSVDLRSSDEATLKRLDAEVDRIVHEEADRVGMTVNREVTSQEEVASIPSFRDSDMVRTAEAVWREFGPEPYVTDTASNHSSAALRAGVPAISSGVAPCTESHSITESCEIEPIFVGTKRNIVLAAALAR